MLNPFRFAGAAWDGYPNIEGWEFTTGGSGDVSSLVMNMPSGIEAGDLLICIMMADDNDPDFWAASGWTTVVDRAINVNPAVDIKSKIAVGSDTLTAGSISPSCEVMGWVLRISHQNATWFGDKEENGTSNSSTIAVQEVTTEANNSLVIYAGVFDGADGYPLSLSPNAGLYTQEDTQRNADESAAGVSGCWGWKKVATAGKAGTATMNAQASDGFVSVAIEVKVET